MKIICFVVAGDPAPVHHLVGGAAGDPAPVRHLVAGDPAGVPFGRLFDHLVVDDPSLVYHLGDDVTHLLRAVPLAWPVVPRSVFRCAES